MDASIGQIMDKVRTENDGNTLVFFASDNGPWLVRFEDGGTSGLLRGGKGSTWEGGIREPGIVWWPGKIPGGVVSDVAVSTMDIFVTVLALAEIPLPTDRIFDGRDMSKVLFDGAQETPHEFMFHYRGTPEGPDKPGLWAVRWTESRMKQWKVHFVTKCGYCSDKAVFHDPPLVFNLVKDPGEHFSINVTENKKFMYVVEAVQAAVKVHKADLKPVANQDRDHNCREYCQCCDWDSQKKYPQYPPCTCNPQNWHRLASDPPDPISSQKSTLF
eukprot:TRINITY_DN4142_c0_g1_i1.p1 TRINITY_DN4142_c0_g1~~TRINITY_DN4142_c0_g1_i1.p1  ORF type:complete len:272 (+),score=36.51 TRINITY_DN4142_c0_g1_i1:772-1587(+)